MPTATTEKVVFTSKSPNLRVLLKARRERMLMDGAGQVVARPQVATEDLPEQDWLRAFNEEAERINEEAGEEKVSLVDVASLPSGVDFKNWKFETDDPNVIAALRAHPNNGKEVAGFNERFATAEERLAEVAQLTARGDVDGLRALLELERIQGNHASVLEAGAIALDALDTEAEPEGDAEGETAEAGSTDDSSEPPGEPAPS